LRTSTHPLRKNKKRFKRETTKINLRLHHFAVWIARWFERTPRLPSKQAVTRFWPDGV
jgi:hypothetical protein